MSKELWTDLDELMFQMGDMHGEALLPDPDDVGGNDPEGDRPATKEDVDFSFEPNEVTITNPHDNGNGNRNAS